MPKSYSAVFLTVFLFTTNTSLCYSVGGDSTDVVITENNPDKALFVIGIPLNFSFSGYNTSLFSLGVHAQLSTPKFSIYTIAKYNIWDRVGHDDDMTVMSIYYPDPSRMLSSVATFVLSNRVKLKPVRVVISKSSLGNGRYLTRYIKVNSLVGNRIGLDVGAQIGTSYYFLDDISFNAIANDGTELPVGDFPVTIAEQMSTFYNYGFVKLGINYTEAEQVKVNTRWGALKTEGLTTVYGHVFLGFHRKLDSVYYRMENPYLPEEDDYLVPLDISTNMPYRKAGWALGFNVVMPDRFNVDYSLEFGCFPGPKQNFLADTYLDFSVRFQFGKYFRQSLNPIED